MLESTAFYPYGYEDIGRGQIFYQIYGKLYRPMPNIRPRGFPMPHIRPRMVVATDEGQEWPSCIWYKGPFGRPMLDIRPSSTVLYQI